MERETTNNKIIECQKELASLISKHASAEGKQHTIIPTLQLLRASNVSEHLHSIYEPSLIVIAQGSKIVMLGDEAYQYDAASYLVSSVHLPIVGRIIEATPQKPYLCVQINFRTDQILDVVKETDQIWTGKTDSGRGLVVNKTNTALLDAVLRFVRLLDTPQDIHMLSPLITREILYRVLQDDQGNVIKQFAINGSHSHSIGKIIKLINDDFAKPLRIEELASKANMSTSSLHSQFKRVTAMSPLQYQKMIRLQEARRLLLTDSSMDAADVGFQVGYESPSQFSREYARMFGLPPISDVKQLRDSLSLNLSLI
ncbi:AraC family transcriptional regulator [Desulfosporosinus fructosivorans]|uniref:AraC family transcriptional regulator n=1 Tax=Desulfosporosinus fructosivorans TaxID=2018669 RepID=A0A4Z0QXS0_9FIRM|nr:AraC family transcriptional regulator [Desulfosporosinus fructosivorans]TGE34763.1 AraC family transcriptional regulator [Desulfosporosinus fructosivorans]